MTETTKAVILARGLGTRMRKTDDSVEVSGDAAAVADTGVKAMIPVDGDRPFLDFVLTSLADAGYTRVCLVIGPEHQAVRDYYDGLDTQRLSVEFAIQAEPLGTADAVAAAEAIADGDDIIVINSDNYYPVVAFETLRTLGSAGLAAFERTAMIDGSNIPLERVSKFAVIESTDAVMSRIIEKPSDEQIAALPEPICVSMNCWRFTAKIFDACRAIEPSPRGELEITDAVQYAIEELDERFAAPVISAPVLDLSSRGDIAAVQQALQGVTIDL